MDAIFALIFVFYILSAVVQALMGKDARRRQRGAGEPWPKVHPPGKTRDENVNIPQGFPFPFPFEDVFLEKHEEEAMPDDGEPEDETVFSSEDDRHKNVELWEDKSWGSLGESLEGISLEHAEYDDFARSGFADDFDDIDLEEDDVAELMIPEDAVAFKWEGFTSRSQVVQGIIMSEVLKRPKAFSRYSNIRK